MSEENTNDSQGDTGAVEDTTQTTDQNVNPGDTGGDPEPSFLDSIQNEELRSNEALKDFKDVDGLAAKYAEVVKENSDLKESVPVVPDDSTGYEIDIPEGIKVDDADMGMFKDAALKAGLTNDQYKAVLQFDFARQQQMVKDAHDAQETAVSEMKKEFGDKFKEKLELTKKVLEKSGAESLMKRHDVGNDTDLFKMLVWVGEKLSEDSLESGGPGGSTKTATTSDGRPMLDFSDM